MKNLIIFISLVLISTLCLADEETFAPTNCNGYVSFPSVSATLNCMNGYCSGFISPQTVYAEGSCDDDNFSANAMTNSIYISASCNGGFMTINSTSQNIYFNGTCGGDGSFNGYAYTPPVFTNASCQSNGPVFLYFPGGQASITGSCTRP